MRKISTAWKNTLPCRGNIKYFLRLTIRAAMTRAACLYDSICLFRHQCLLFAFAAGSFFLMIFISLAAAYFATTGSLSSQRTMLDASGISLLRWIASNSQRVVHRPQPMQRLRSTTVAPQPRHREASVLICSSVKGRRRSAKVPTGQKIQ